MQRSSCITHLKLSLNSLPKLTGGLGGCNLYSAEDVAGIFEAVHNYKAMFRHFKQSFWARLNA